MRRIPIAWGRRLAEPHTESCTLRILRLACVFCIAACIAAKQPLIGVPTNEPGLIRLPENETIPPGTLAEMFRAELGQAYDPVLADRLDRAHALLEQYFASHSAGERRTIVQSLEATKIDPGVLGRLCRIRSHWPALQGGGVFYVNRRKGPFDIRYFLGVPKSYDRTKPWPLVIKLPDAMSFLTDPPPDAQRVTQIYTAWIQDELSRHGDALVLMPLLDLEEVYGPSYAGMNGVMQPMFDASDRVNVDPARVYLTGHSIGAMGVWYVALHYPTYFAAISPLAGAVRADFERLRLMNLRNVLPVIWHDDEDKAIKIGFAKSLVNELKAMKIDVDFYESRGIGHDPTPQVIESEYHRMRSVVRNLYPTQVWLKTNRPDVLLNRNDWVQIYQELDPGKEQRLYFRHTTGHMTVYSNSCGVKAEIHANQINASADNIDALRFYVNDQMANLAEPVTVTINKKVKFKQVVKQSIDDMLKDQVFLGRGWRYYTGVIDIEMVDHPTANPATRPATRPLQKGRIIVGPMPADQ